MDRKVPGSSSLPARARQTRGRSAPPRRRRWPWIVGACAILAVVIAGVALTRGGSGGPSLTAADVTTFDNVESGHQDGPLSYPQTPPVGGIHNATWQTCGAYRKPLANENAVHSLEHGAVWITYQPDLPTDAVERLAGLVRGRSHVLLSPYPDIPAPVVASAWGVQLKAESADDGRIEQFIAKYEEGPQTLEPGATCRGGNNLPK